MEHAELHQQRFDGRRPGFNFDTQVTNAFGSTVHLMAANFYNPGTISCASEYSDYYSEYLLDMPGQFIVSATNICDARRHGDRGHWAGSVTNGLISFIGQNVDLSSSTLTMGSASTGTMGSVAAIPNTTSILLCRLRAGHECGLGSECLALTASTAYAVARPYGNI